MSSEWIVNPATRDEREVILARITRMKKNRVLAFAITIASVIAILVGAFFLIPNRYEAARTQIIPEEVINAALASSVTDVPKDILVPLSFYNSYPLGTDAESARAQTREVAAQLSSQFDLEFTSYPTSPMQSPGFAALNVEVPMTRDHVMAEMDHEGVTTGQALGLAEDEGFRYWSVSDVALSIHASYSPEDIALKDISDAFAQAIGSERSYDAQMQTISAWHYAPPTMNPDGVSQTFVVYASGIPEIRAAAEVILGPWQYLSDIMVAIILVPIMITAIALGLVFEYTSRRIRRAEKELVAEGMEMDPSILDGWDASDDVSDQAKWDAAVLIRQLNALIAEREALDTAYLTDRMTTEREEHYRALMERENKLTRKIAVMLR